MTTIRCTEKSTSFDRELWETCDQRPAHCDLTRGEPGDCSCTTATGCTYLGKGATFGPAGLSNWQLKRVEEGW